MRHCEPCVAVAVQCGKWCEKIHAHAVIASGFEKTAKQSTTRQSRVLRQNSRQKRTACVMDCFGVCHASQ